MNNSKQQFAETLAAAMDIVAAFRIDNLDALDARAAAAIRRGWAHQLAAQRGVTFATAVNHITRACRRQRDPDWQPGSNWGGVRPGAGRPATID